MQWLLQQLCSQAAAVIAMNAATQCQNHVLQDNIVHGHVLLHAQHHALHHAQLQVKVTKLRVL